VVAAAVATTIAMCTTDVDRLLRCRNDCNDSCAVHSVTGLEDKRQEAQLLLW